MNQTQKRLSIIKTAISIGDEETIQLQILKLSPLRTDEKIQEILRGLEAKNYAQTLPLITEYIETPPEVILQRTVQNEPPSPQEEEAIIEEFDLFKVPAKEEPESVKEIVDIEGFVGSDLPIDDSPSQKKTNSIDYDALLSLKSDEILPDNIDIKQTRLEKEDDDDFFTPTEEDSLFENSAIEKDDFFHAEEEPDTTLPNETGFPDTLLEETADEAEEEFIEDALQEFENPVVPQPVVAATVKESSPKEASAELPSEPDDAVPCYEPIPYIDQKLKNLLTQYPPAELPSKSLESVNSWLQKIANEGYTETEIEALVESAMNLSNEGEKAEAAQLLLIAAATRSLYAQFMLARSLFKGDLLEQNLPEAFTLINRMAMDDNYPEALCDLAQLYEHGIGIEKDKARAEALYKEAMEAGIKRAKPHYERLAKGNKGLFGKLFGK